MNPIGGTIETSEDGLFSFSNLNNEVGTNSKVVIVDDENPEGIVICSLGDLEETYGINGEFATNGVVSNTLKHEKGVLSMARAGDPNSAGSQFFIMLGTAEHLDGSYAAFGKVIEGMDIIEYIEKREAVNGDRLVQNLTLKKAVYDLNGYQFVEPIKLEILIS